jgi:integrase
MIPVSAFGTRSGTRLPAGSLVITVGAGDQPFWEGKWRHQGRQIKRRIGPAWLVPNGSQWKKAPGRAPEGVLDRTDALIALRAMIAGHAAQEAENAAPRMPSFAQAAELWYQRAERRGRKPATLLAYRWVIDAHILGQRTFKSTVIKTVCPFSDTPIDKITKQDMRDWFDPIPNRPQKYNVLKIVKGICKFAVEEGWVRKNVALHVECSLNYDGSYDYFTAGEIERLIAHARDEYDACLYATAAYTGLRRGEIFGLQWGDIDFDGARIVVKRNYSGRELVTPKNGRTRVVPLVPALAERLENFRANPPGPSAFIFPGSADAAMDRYRATLKRAGLRHLPFHSLRHSFGSYAVTVATLVQVRDWLGHSDLRMTARYLHVKNLASDADLLGSAF